MPHNKNRQAHATAASAQCFPAPGSETSTASCHPLSHPFHPIIYS
jgi:hypothetical protein